MLIDLNEFKSKKNNGFIVLDGLNGSGKGTLQKKIETYLTKNNQKSILTREPGGSAIGTVLRELVLSSHYKLDPISEVLLFNAERREHVKKIIEPNLENKIKVICDRYYYSTLAFQGAGRGLDINFLKQVNERVVENTKPDLVIILDVDPVVGLKRTASRKEEDKFESEKVDFQQRLRQGFLQMASELEENFVVLDANQSQDMVWNNCLPWIESWVRGCK